MMTYEQAVECLEKLPRGWASKYMANAKRTGVFAIQLGLDYHVFQLPGGETVMVRNGANGAKIYGDMEAIDRFLTTMPTVIHMEATN